MPIIYPADLARPEVRQQLADLLAHLEVADGTGPLDVGRVREALHLSRHLLIRFPVALLPAGMHLLALHDELMAASRQLRPWPWAPTQALAVRALRAIIQATDTLLARGYRFA